MCYCLPESHEEKHETKLGGWWMSDRRVRARSKVKPGDIFPECDVPRASVSVQETEAEDECTHIIEFL